MNILFVVGTFSTIEPLGVLYISAAVKKEGHQTFIAAIDENNSEDIIKEKNIDLVAFSFMSTEAKDFQALSKRIKIQYPDIFIVAGGPHPTYYPHIADEWPIDAVILGEGDLIIGEVAKKLKEGTDLSGTPNIQTKDYKSTDMRVVSDLNVLPFADREIIKDIAPYKYIRMRSFFATRGCPYSCAYCFNSAYNAMFKGCGSIVRRRSVENIISEIEEVKNNYPMDFLRFGDDVFAMKYDDWVIDFCKQYKKRINLPFYILIHPNFIEEDLIKSLREAGCHSAMIGIEAGTPELRKEILDRFVPDHQITDGLKIMNKHGIKVFSNTMLALPGTSLEDDLQSLNFSLDCKSTYSGFTFCTPFPGTKLHEKCKERGYLSDEDLTTDSIPKSLQSGSFVNTVTEEQKRVIKNIIQLAPIANYFPFTRKLIVNHLIYWKPNPIFRFLGFLVRNFIITTIFPFRKSPLAFISILKKVVSIDKGNYNAKKAG